MNRYHLLAAACALLIPAILPDRSETSHEAPQTAPRQPVVAETQQPASLGEALTRVAASAEQPFRDEARCLAQAVYFEARSEPALGQLAVAQVVLNRVGSPFWPNSICEVVFQNEHRRHRCQFSFACDGRSDEPHNPHAWRTAKMVAAVALEDLWEDVTDAATHYHAVYVAPSWRSAMAPTTKHGLHVFYRDRRLAGIASSAPDMTVLRRQDVALGGS